MTDGRWFGEVPKGWEVQRLKRTVVLSKARTDERPSELRYIGLENIESWTGRIVDSVDSIIEDDDIVETSGVVSLFEPGDVLFGKLRPYLAKAWLVTEPCVGTTELLALKPYPILRARFLLYVLLTPGFISLVDSSTFGTKMPRADWEFIGNVMIPLPTLIEQQAIVSLLDSETSQIDILITEKESLVTLLTEKRRSLITYAVALGLAPNALLRDSDLPWLGDIPEHWRIERAKYLFKQSSLPVNEQDEIVTCFRDGQVTLRKNRREEGFTNAILELGYQGIRAGQLVLHSMDAFAGAIGVSDSDGKCSPEYIVCDPVSEEIVNDYYGYLLRTMALSGFIQASCPAVRERAPRIRFNDFGEMFLPVPPPDEQRAIVKHIETETKKLDDLRTETERTIGLLKERRAALIAAAVTGQLNVGVQA